MSTNVYFNKKVLELPGFSKESGKINGMYLFDRDGRMYVMFRDNDLIPTELEELVDEISLHSQIPPFPHRETGIYQHESAEAEVEIDFSKDKECLTIKIVGKKMEDVRGLLRMIKTGTIRPDESYEGRQQGKSRQELEAELADTNALLKAAQQKMVDQKIKLEDIRSLAGDLRASDWPFCKKRGVAGQILGILIFDRKE